MGEAGGGYRPPWFVAFLGRRLVWALVTNGMMPGLPGPVPLAAFTVHFLVVWILVWLAANGPMRVPFLRWRFRGGRLV